MTQRKHSERTSILKVIFGLTLMAASLFISIQAVIKCYDAFRSLGDLKEEVAVMKSEVASMRIGLREVRYIAEQVELKTNELAQKN